MLSSTDRHFEAIMIIQSATYIISNTDWRKSPPPDKPEYAFIGRSNVGKSTLINMLTDRTRLAKVSGTPGKTQTINHFLINEAWYLVDLPGYGFAKVARQQREQWSKMSGEYLRNRSNLGCVFVLLDSRLTPQEADLSFIRQLGEWEVPFSLVFTKSDKNTQLVTSRNVKAFLNKLKEDWEFLPPHFVTSAVKRSGREALLEYIGELNIRFGAIARGS
ncbi:ribosome biogenesis GTP-binding protein YihA/YsxC [Compostibacter hankyongensis]|uniref:Probable GTP-binding protein EngB n=1 Tax=Compostibacter hankyongensis TaxID=1007089 RepID=A0ABP8G7Z1_9BACT